MQAHVAHRPRHRADIPGILRANEDNAQIPQTHNSASGVVRHENSFSV
jgi:hypothetical protein